MNFLKSCICTTVLALFFGLPAFSQSLGTINFDFDSDKLDAQALQQVAEIAETLKSTDSYKPTVIVGYTDAVGGSRYNRDLGLRRANAVAEAMRAQGVPVDRVGKTESRGKNELLVAVASPERLNRRVTISLEDILAACRSYRDVDLAESSVGSALQSDLERYVIEAARYYSQLTTSGQNGPAFQMAGAARSDCEQAAGYQNDSIRKVEYAKKCFCSTARMQVALGQLR